MDENNKLPAGWGDAEDDEDYGFLEEEEDSPWGAEAMSKAPSAFEPDEPIESETVQQNEAQGNVQSDAAPAVSADAAGTQIMSSTKKTPMIAVLVGIIVVLAAGGGVLGGILLSRGQGNTAEHTDETEPSETSSVSMESTESAAESASESETLQADSQAETKTNVTDVPYEVYEEASIRALDAFLQTYNLGSPEDPYYLDSVMYSLIDINEDGVPELLIEYPTELDDFADLYIYDGSEYKENETYLCADTKVCVSEHLIETHIYEGGRVRYVYEMDADGNISLKDEINYGYDYYCDYYTLNGEEISSSEYDEINSYYDSLRWETIDRYEYKRSGVDMPETTEPTDAVETPSLSKPQALYAPVVMDPGIITNYPSYVSLLEKIHGIVSQGCDYNDCIQNDICIYYENAELSDIGYVLYDLNADEMPELIITKDGSMIEMYTIKSSGVQLLCQDAERYWHNLSSSGLIVESSTGNSGFSTYFYSLNDASELTYVAVIAGNYNDDGTVQYYYDRNEITESQATELLDFSIVEFECTRITDVIATEPPAQSVPTIDAWIETRSIPVDDDGDGIYEAVADGCALYLCVSGDYDSYYFEFYMAEPDGSNPVLYDSGTVSYSEIYLTSGSGGFSVIVGLIPYAADGTQGEAVYASLVL